jgi:hypothetical protein
MTELIQLKNVDYDSKILLLKELGYSSDGKNIYYKNGKKVVDKYIEQPVQIDNMLILPGSTIILDDNPLSIALYMEENSGVIG